MIENFSSITTSASLNRLKQFRQATTNIEGWFYNLSQVLWDILLEKQKTENIRGGLLEIGAWHGKSAIMLLMHSRANEEVFVVDIEVREPLKTNLAELSEKFSCKYQLLKGNSYTFFNPDFISKHYRKLRWIHIDGDHSQYGIHNDLDIANQLLHPFGVIVIDDFLNAHFPQISEVTFEYLLNHRHELTMILCGGNKAYLIRPKVFDTYYNFLKNSLETEITNRELKVNIYDGTNNNRPCFCVRD